MLAYRTPFDWANLIGFLAPRAIPGVEVVDASSYRRTAEIDGRRATLDIRPSPDRDHLAFTLDVLGAGGGARGTQFARAPAAVSAARRLFDLDCDPEPVARHLASDPSLEASVRARPGLRVPGAWDRFEVAVRAVIGQQVSVKGARTLATRIVARAGDPVEGGPSGLTHLFPNAARLACADLSGLGMTTQREATIRRLAEAVEDGDVDLAATDLDHLTSALVAVPGVGPWTAHYIALRSGHTDAFPAGDLWLRRAAGVDERQLRERAEAWRPFRAYAALHLWTSPPPTN